MRITKYICVDLSTRGCINMIDAVQGDTARELEISLYSNGSCWEVPSGAAVLIRFRKFDGTGGTYDTLPGGSRAYSFEGNVLRVALAPQVLTVEGTVTLQVAFLQGTGIVATFPMIIRVHPDPSFGTVKSEDYTSIGEWVLPEATEAANQATEAANQAVEYWHKAEKAAQQAENAAQQVTDPVLEVTIDHVDGVYLADVSFEDIFSAHNQNREVRCFVGNAILHPHMINSAKAVFQTVSGASHRRVTILSDNTVTNELFAYALRDELGSYAADETYFEITDDGMVYLKPEYRGAVTESESTSALGKYVTSDLGYGTPGSKIHEFPAVLVIPDVVRGIPVNSLVGGMFIRNEAVKKVVIPSGITEIPRMCFYRAYSFEEVAGVEGVTTIATQAFYMTAIRKAFFPNLKEFTGRNNFYQCSKLCVVDIGHVTSIPQGCFCHCVRLHTVRNGKEITSVERGGFHNTSTLKMPEFVPSLTYIGDIAFLYSRIDYDWLSLAESNDCQFGELYPTTDHMNPTKWWVGTETVPCETPLYSTFDQQDPRWADVEMLPGQMTWRDGCTMCACAHMYSAFERRHLSSPAEFIQAVVEADPQLSQEIIGIKSTHIAFLRAVGYTVEANNPTTGKELTVANDLQYLYDALAAGHLVLVGVPVGESTNVAHCVVLYGINENGEVLFVNSAGDDYAIGEYGASLGCMPIQTFTKSICDFIVVKKG